MLTMVCRVGQILCLALCLLQYEKKISLEIAKALDLPIY